VSSYLSWWHEVEYALRYRDLSGLVVAEISAEPEPTLVETPRQMWLRSASVEKKEAAGSSGVAKMAQAADEARATARAQDDLSSDQAFATTAAGQRSRAEKARVVLMMSVKAHHGTKLRRYSNARALWAALAADFKPKGSARAIELRRQLNTISMEEGESLVRYFNRGWELVGHLGEMGIEIDYHHLLSVLLLGLTPRFELTAEIMRNYRHLKLREALEELQAVSYCFALE